MSVCSIILNWNNYIDTDRTIRSLLDQDYFHHDIILVDNASEYSIKSRLKSKYPFISHIWNYRNFGYTGGNNIGIIRALQINSDYIIICNNDIEIIDKKLISKAISIFKKYKEISILGPCIYNYYKKSEIQEKGTTFFHSDEDTVYLNDYINPSRIITDKIKYYDGVPGAFMFVRKEVFNKIGLFDEKIFMYGDETDLCYRGWVNGICSAISEDLVVYHKGQKKYKKKNPLITYYMTRNSLYFLLKHRATIENFRYFSLKCIRGHISLTLSYFRKYKLYGYLIKPTVKGMIDGLFGKMN